VSGAAPLLPRVAAPALARPTAWRLAQGYFELTKPRIVSLILMTGVPALLMAAHGLPAARLSAATLLGIALAAASGSAFNNFVDRDIDGLMRRTAGRPLPTGVLSPAQALGWASLLAALSWLVLAGWVNLLAAGIGLASIFYYAVIYTVWLKRRTPQNIVIGGAAGASAPLIAWAAVTGRVELPAIALAAIVFFWTPPHFWSLALYRRDDYLRAGLPMLPVTHGEEETRRQIVLYAVALVPVTLLPVLLGAAGPLYAIPALAMGVAFVAQAVRLLRSRSSADAARLFGFSILHLFLIFVLLTLDVAIRNLGRTQAWGA
jgi:protoheme IX farnesyltransferase